jgi:flagellar basal body P-ring formation protein FlgA
MTMQFPVMSAATQPAGRLSAMMVVRTVLALAAMFLLIGSALAAERLQLRGDIVARTDALTLADLVEGAPAGAADTPLFRAPALGTSGTIQARRILDAARKLGLGQVETGGRAQIVVTRAARRIAANEIEAAVKRALESRYGVEARALGIVFDGTPPALAVAPDVKGELTVEDLSYDRASRRVSALVWIGPSAAERKAAARVSGAAVEQIEVAIVTRALNRGDTAQAGDFVVEKRAKESVPSDVQTEVQGLAGRVARRALAAGAMVRVADLARPEIVGRGDIVTIVYEVPGMTLTLRGRASEAGAQGDTITVVNPQSKKTLHGQVVAPGRVSVSAPLPGRIAAASVTP